MLLLLVLLTRLASCDRRESLIRETGDALRLLLPRKMILHFSKCSLCKVLVVATKHHRGAILLSHEVGLCLADIGRRAWEGQLVLYMLVKVVIEGIRYLNRRLQSEIKVDILLSAGHFRYPKLLYNLQVFIWSLLGDSEAGHIKIGLLVEL